MNAPAPLAYSRREAADAARMSVEEIDRAIRRGELRAKRPARPDGDVGKRVIIPADALAAWLNNLPDA